VGPRGIVPWTVKEGGEKLEWRERNRRRRQNANANEIEIVNELANFLSATSKRYLYHS
jgi:hypothetical protein